MGITLDLNHIYIVNHFDNARATRKKLRLHVKAKIVVTMTTRKRRYHVNALTLVTMAMRKSDDVHGNEKKKRTRFPCQRQNWRNHGNEKKKRTTLRSEALRENCSNAQAIFRNQLGS